MPETATPLLGPRFGKAFNLAFQLHAGQLRKASRVPYVAHLMGVCALVLQDGGDEDEAVAAILHDAAEDRGGEETLARIRAEFGDLVARIVDECSDTYEDPKPPWRARKQAHLARLEKALPATHRIMLADKLHNARALLRDLRREGESAWDKFNGGKQGTLWYYQQAHAVLGRHYKGYLWEEFGRVLAEVQRLSHAG